MTDAEPSVACLALSGPLVVRTIAAVHATLLEALSGGQAVIVDCTDAESVDASFIQLLLAARRGAHEAGQPFSLAAPAGGALREALERGGFLPPDGADPFWLGET